MSLNVVVPESIKMAHIANNDERDVKLELIKTINNIKQKYRSLQQQSQNLDEALNIQYKPIITALDKVSNNNNNNGNDSQNIDNVQSSEGNENKKNDWNPIVLARKLVNIDEYLQIIDTADHDKEYGIKMRNGKYYIGKVEVKFTHDKIYIENESFPLTRGLANLLFLKLPRKFTQTDKDAYRQIIQISKLHIPIVNTRRTNNFFKIAHIISPMFEKKGGKSLQTDYMEVSRNGKIDYKYWDDSNELVERLRLLIASQSAGHSGHNNEIIEIIEELREAEIIH